MLCTDDVVLIDTSKEGVEGKLKLWANILKSQGLRISQATTEYMNMIYNFSETTMRESSFIHLESHELPQKGILSTLALC